MFEALISLASIIVVLIIFQRLKGHAPVIPHLPIHTLIGPNATPKKLQIPSTLWGLVKNDLFSSAAEISNDGETRTTGATFRLRDGRLVPLVVDDIGNVKGVIIGGQDGVREEYDFEATDLVALAGMRKQKTGWLPWNYRWEFYDRITVK